MQCAVHVEENARALAQLALDAVRVVRVAHKGVEEHAAAQDLLQCGVELAEEVSHERPCDEAVVGALAVVPPVRSKSNE